MLWALIMCSLSVFSSSIKGNDNRFNKVSFQSLPSLEISPNQGVSGAFSGNIDGQAIVAGGCNFPNTPADEGGTKVFYNTVYALRGQQWRKIGELPQALAYGVSVTTKEGIICFAQN